MLLSLLSSCPSGRGASASLNDFACLFKQTLVIHLYTNESFTELNPPELQEHLIGSNSEEISQPSKMGSTSMKKKLQCFCAEIFFYFILNHTENLLCVPVLHLQPKLISTVQYHTVLKSMIPVLLLGNKSIIV